MTMPRLRLKAPTANGASLAIPSIPLMAYAIRQAAKRPGDAERRSARRELLEAAQQYHLERNVPPPPGNLDADAPLILTGHQPELFHPGVWAKNFLLARLAQATQANAVNLIVDQDLCKQTSVKVPCLGAAPRSVQLATVHFDEAAQAEPYETRTIRQPDLFAGFADAVQTTTQNWPFEPILKTIWPGIVADSATTIGERFATMRRRLEHSWGVINWELPVSRLVTLDCFARFVADLEARLPEFHEAYHQALHEYRRAYKLKSTSHPAPDLAPGERPFWHLQNGQRQRPFTAYPASELRPRALTLTLFVRQHLADFFLHGLGGGLYDQVTDRIAKLFYQQPLPTYGVFTQTYHLPFPHRPATPNDLAAARRNLRDLRWNPHRFLPADHPTLDEFRQLLQTDTTTRQQRRDQFRKLRDWKAKHQPCQTTLAKTKTISQQLEAELATNQLLQQRDYPWVLYPEDLLQNRFTQLLASDAATI